MKYRAVSEHLGKSRSRSEVASFFMAPVQYPELVMDVLIEKHARGESPLRAAKPKTGSHNRLAPQKKKAAPPQATRPAPRQASKTPPPFRLSFKTLAGIGFIVFGSGGSRSVPEGWSKEDAAAQIVDVLRHIAPAAERHGVTIVMEPLNSGECNILNSLAEAAEVVEKAEHPSVKLLADLYHMAVDGESPSEIGRFAAIIRHVHVAELEKRTAPGVDGDDFRPYLKALAAGGFSGGISMECLWGDLADEVPKAVEYLRGQLADAGL